MTRLSKNVLLNILDPKLRGEVKRVLIDAQLREEAARREALRNKDVGDSKSENKNDGKGRGNPKRTSNSRSSVEVE